MYVCVKREVELDEARDAWKAGVVYTTSKDRGVGKTRLILAYAIESGMPIVVSSRSVVKEYAPAVVPLGIKMYAMDDSVGLRGVRFPKGVLVDDITESQYKALKGIHSLPSNIIGFVRSDGGY